MNKCILFVLGFFTMTIIPAHSQSPDGGFSNPVRFVPRNGEALYRAACQACHMPDGEGAVGAGVYPPLANNPRLRTAGYSTLVILKGSRAMPPFRDQLDDEQVAAVVNYIGTHFGKGDTMLISAADVKAVR